jgi:membrane protein DedA with SNARE-associated domain
MRELIHSLVDWSVNIISEIGYIGIFIGMFLESTLFPIPSEVIMIPAGMAAAKGNFNIYLVTIIGTLGNILGAIFSYYLALFLGHPVIIKIGKYFFVKESTIIKIEKFFAKYGSISVFFGRLLPGFRHFISLPAGLAKMNIRKFILYTSLGSSIWTSILTVFGFFIGKNMDLIESYLNQLVILVLIFAAISFFLVKKFNKNN